VRREGLMMMTTTMTRMTMMMMMMTTMTTTTPRPPRPSGRRRRRRRVGRVGAGGERERARRGVGGMAGTDTGPRGGAGVGESREEGHTDRDGASDCGRGRESGRGRRAAATEPSMASRVARTAYVSWRDGVTGIGECAKTRPFSHKGYRSQLHTHIRLQRVRGLLVRLCFHRG
jgi:hypothetical protein